MNRYGRLLAFFASCMLVVTASAQDSGLDFLRIGPDAGATALGDANVAGSNDAYATYWNPAGLAAAERNSAAISHHLWVGDVRTYALATRLGFGERGALGFSVTAMGSSDLEMRDAPGDPIGFFGAQFMSLGGSYGRTIGPVRLGVTAKYLFEEISDVSANGYAFDFGAQAELWDGAVELGAAFVNVGRMSEFATRETKLPRMLRGGVALHPLRVLSGDDDASVVEALLIAEVSHVVPDERTRLHVGVGAEVMELVIVRLGYVGNDDLRTFTFGLGLEYEPFRMDYAFLPFEKGFDGPGHVLSLSYRW